MDQSTHPESEPIPPSVPSTGGVPGDDPSGSGPAVDWVGERARQWVALADALERQLAPVSDILFAHAGLTKGDRVLDVGCGTGPTTRRAAAIVGAAGSVTGLDIAPEMLDAARARTVEHAGARIDWVESDATSFEGSEDGYDRVISRFGVMFFDDPGAAFSRLAAVTRPGGTFTAVVWPVRDRTGLFSVPYEAAVAAIERRGETVHHPPGDSGPCSLGTPEVACGLLGRSGWVDATFTEVEVALQPGGGLPPEGAAVSLVDMGPVRLITEHLGDEERESVRQEVVAVLGRYVVDGRVVLPCRVCVLSARKPEGE